MPLDGISAKFLAIDLKERLSGAKVDRIYQLNRHTVLFYFRFGRENRKLLISVNPSSPRLHLSSRDFTNPQNPPTFCMMLRKYLLGGILDDVIQPDYERVFMFKFSTLNDFGEKTSKYLVAEIMGRHSNLIFLNEEQKIHDAIIHVDADMSSKREVMPAREYKLPPGQDKKSIDYYLENREDILPFLKDSKLLLEKAFLSHIAGFSPLISRAVVDGANLDDRLHVDLLSDQQKVALSRSFYRMANRIQRGDLSPSLYFKDAHDTKPFDFHALAFETQPYIKTLDDFSMTMDIFYALQDEDQAFKQETNRIERLLSQKILHTQKKMDFHQKDFAEGQKADYYQRIGELLNSQLYLIQDGAKEAKIIDYYDPDQKVIKVPLKSHLSPSDNAAMFFRRYRKAKTKLEKSQKLLQEDRHELSWLFSLKTAVDKAENMDDLQAISDELIALDEARLKKRADHPGQPDKHILKNTLNPGKPGKKSKRKQFKQQRKKQEKQKKSKKELPLPPRHFILDQGIEVFAGRNNIQNDELTFKKAKADDLWFHAKDIPGTHVILQADDNFKIEEEHIEAAASIAAWYADSNKVKTGRGGHIPVDYTLAKYVRKIKGAKPGMVVYDHHKTCQAKPRLPEK